MKSLLPSLCCALLISACQFNTEVFRDSSEAVTADLDLLIAKNYQALYDDASIEMKSYVDEDIFLNILDLQDKVLGSLSSYELIDQGSGNYRSQQTDIYNYRLLSSSGESFTYNAEYLKGHLLKQFIEVEDYREEPAFVKNHTAEARQLVADNDYGKIFQLLEGKYPITDVQNLVEGLSEDLKDVDNRFLYHWTDNDANGNMLVAFVYAYAGKGYLEYRYFIDGDRYPLAGIFFSPDASVSLPQS